MTNSSTLFFVSMKTELKRFWESIRRYFFTKKKGREKKFIFYLSKDWLILSNFRLHCELPPLKRLKKLLTYIFYALYVHVSSYVAAPYCIVLLFSLPGLFTEITTGITRNVNVSHHLWNSIIQRNSNVSYNQFYSSVSLLRETWV